MNMLDRYEIRAAKPGDLEQIFMLWGALMDDHAEYDCFWERAPGADEMFRSWMSKQINIATSCVVVAASEDRLLGYVGGLENFHPPIYRVSRHLLLTDMYVLPADRCKGVGAALVDYVKDWAAAHGYERVELSAAPQNEAGLRFWARVGFIEYQRYLAFKKPSTSAYITGR